MALIFLHIEVYKSPEGRFLQISSEELLTQIRTQIAVYQHCVKSDNKAHRYNINDRAEVFTIPLFKLLFGWDELEDLNLDQANYPGIDLGDEKNRVAIQVTSETSLGKVKDSIAKFTKNAYYKKYERLVIFMIRDKQSSYSEAAISKSCDGKIDFKYREDIIDLSDLMRFIKSLSKNELEVVLRLFQDETGYIENSPIIEILETEEHHFDPPKDPPFENGLLNLVEIGFPNTLYLGEWNFSKKSLGTKIRNDSKLVKEALSQQDLKFSVDWVTIEKQIITFHDLSDANIPLSKVVDQGTVTELESDEIYDNPFYRTKFVELLQKCLQQKLFKLSIYWQHQEKEYIFCPINEKDEVRKIEWKEIKTDERTVYRQIPDLKDESKVYCHEHFAFETRFYYLDSTWYLAFTPDWFYSSDGYKRAWYAIEDKRKYKKRVETNQSISTHVRFLKSFISVNDPQKRQQMGLFADKEPEYYPYKYLWIKNIQELNRLPRLPDSKWKPISSRVLDTSKTLFSGL